uniref:Uncharacterized protein n=1 Tax=viral metagenome TaxID=1070528 RepID=A0A6C0BQP7_9ZZZZ
MDFINLINSIILSLIFIYLIHTIFNYFKDTFTQKKTFDYIDNPNIKYKNIYEKINSGVKKSEIEENIPIPSITSIPSIPSIPNQTDTNIDGTTNISDLDDNLSQKTETTNMKDQLKKFLKNVQSNDVNGYGNNKSLDNNKL